jgi:L-lactate dehydrogenase
MKISVIGLGKVGTATAYALVLRGLTHELVLVGTDPARAEGEALDLLHASVFVRPMTVRAGDIPETKDSDIVIVAASKPAPNWHDRLDMIGPNAPFFRELMPKLAEQSPKAIFIIVSNPLDVLTYLSLHWTGLEPRQVIGSGTLLDTARFRTLLSAKMKINSHDVRAYTLGEHGDSQFPAMSVASAGGMKIDLKDTTIHRMFEEAREAGTRVAKLKGHTNYGVAVSTAMIVEAIVDDMHSIMPVSTLPVGFDGIDDVCLSLPCVIGRAGVERVMPIHLSETELEQLQHSAGVIRKVIEKYKNLPATV